MLPRPRFCQDWLAALPIVLPGFGVECLGILAQTIEKIEIVALYCGTLEAVQPIEIRFGLEDWAVRVARKLSGKRMRAVHVETHYLAHGGRVAVISARQGK